MKTVIPEKKLLATFKDYLAKNGHYAQVLTTDYLFIFAEDVKLC